MEAFLAADAKKRVNVVPSLLRIKGVAQNYDWGKRGLASAVAALGKAGGSLETVKEETSYAELWMGTHPSGISTLAVEGEVGQTLLQYLREHPAAVERAAPSSSSSSTSGDGGLVYLFKVLSIAKALSIQAHPNKKRAEELFRLRPDIYKDDNHKPEMACALTEFEALLGFESLETILANAARTPELRALFEEDGGERGKRAMSAAREATASEGEKNDNKARRAALKEVFSVLMNSKQPDLTRRIGELVARCGRITAAELHETDALAMRLNEQFPNDVGVFCAYVLCYRKLKPGQAVFLGSNEPHAYISGDCVEIMANSDNVIRAGLTPKLRDLPELESMLTYSEFGRGDRDEEGRAVYHPASVLEGEARDRSTSAYAPPDPAVGEFELERMVLTEHEVNPYAMRPSRYASIVLCVEGRGEAKWDQGMERCAVMRGAIFFQPAETKVSFTGNGLVLFRVTKKGAVMMEGR